MPKFVYVFLIFGLLALPCLALILNYSSYHFELYKWISLYCLQSKLSVLSALFIIFAAFGHWLLTKGPLAPLILVAKSTWSLISAVLYHFIEVFKIIWSICCHFWRFLRLIWTIVRFGMAFLSKIVHFFVGPEKSSNFEGSALMNGSSTVPPRQTMSKTPNLPISHNYRRISVPSGNNNVSPKNSPRNPKSVCRECGGQVANATTSLKLHVNLHHLHRPIFACRYCSFVSYYLQNTQIVGHMKNKHPDQDKFDFDDNHTEHVNDLLAMVGQFFPR